MKFISLPLLLLLSFKLFAQSSKDAQNIIISKSSETYTYDYSKSTASVQVVEELSNLYTAVNYRDKGSFYEFFDDQTLLDDVSLIQNGKKVSVSRSLRDYSVEDVFYSDAKVYDLTLDFPKNGWENEVRMTKIYKDPRYFCTVYFSEPYTVKEKTVTLVIPRWMKAEIKEFNFQGFEITRTATYNEKKDADVFVYTIRNLPARKSEERQPGPSHVLPHLLLMNKSATPSGQQFTFFASLKDQYGWYHKIVGMTQNDASVIKAKSNEITAGAKSDMEKVKAILYWVHNNIRYVAFEDGIAGFKPDAAQNVLNKKFGDCKGMANLTRELLKAQGFDARLAWIGTNHVRYDYTTPALCVDNHMICCLVKDGRKYFLDGTETYLAFENYAERIQGRQVLIEDGENYILEHIPATTVGQNLSLFQENVRIEDNAIKGKVEYVFKGESKENILTSIHSSRREDLQKQLEKYISNDNSKYVAANVKTSDINQIDGDLSIQFDVTNPDAVSSFGKDLYVDMDYNKTFNQFLIDSSRKNDYCFPYKSNYSTEVSLEIPQGYSISSLPAGMEYKTESFIMSLNYKTDNNRIIYKKTIQILNPVLRKSSFGEWNKAITKLSAGYAEQVILVKK